PCRISMRCPQCLLNFYRVEITIFASVFCVIDESCCSNVYRVICLVYEHGLLVWCSEKCNSGKAEMLFPVHFAHGTNHTHSRLATIDNCDTLKTLIGIFLLK